jgi:membrane protease YdiL (CAAX protease family)
LVQGADVSELLKQMIEAEGDAFLPALLGLLGVAVVLFALAVGGAVLLRRRGVQLLPLQRWRAVPWYGITIGFLVPLWQLSGGFFGDLLRGIGWLSYLYGPEFLPAFKSKSGLAFRLAGVRYSLWASLAAFPFLVWFVLRVLRQFHGALPYQLGLTMHRFGKNVLLGFLVWLAVITPIYLVHMLVTNAYGQWVGHPEPHPLEELAKHTPYRSEWLLIVVTAVAIAPFLEELFFRGLMLPWATWDEQRSDWLMFWSFVVPLISRADGIRNGLHEHAWTELSIELQPAAFALLLIAGYILLRRRGRPVGCAIYSTAALFACFHATVWPSPVPLFLLGVVLAWSASRTQSLVPPITIHALFNSVACVMLFISVDDNNEASGGRKPPENMTPALSATFSGGLRPPLAGGDLLTFRPACGSARIGRCPHILPLPDQPLLSGEPHAPSPARCTWSRSPAGKSCSIAASCSNAAPRHANATASFPSTRIAWRPSSSATPTSTTAATSPTWCARASADRSTARRRRATSSA